MKHNEQLPSYRDVFFQVMEGGLGMGVYVSDVETHEVVYVNARLCEIMGEGKRPEDYVGEHCYEVFVSAGRSCSFCKLSALRSDADYRRNLSIYNRRVGKHLRIHNALITWADGREVMFHSVCDDGAATQTKASFINRWDRKDAVAAIARHFAVNTGAQNVFDEPLKLVMDMLDVDEVFILRREVELCAFVPAHSQCRPGYRSIFENRGRIPYLAEGKEYAWLKLNEHLEGHELTEFFQESEDAHGRRIALPVFLDGEVWGIFGCVDAREDLCWADADIEFLRMVSDMFTSELERSMIQFNLIKTELTLRSVVDHIPIAIFWKDKNLVYRGVNEQMLKLVGGSRDDVLGKTDFEVQPLRAEEIQRDDLKIIESRQEYYAPSIETKRADGTTMWARVFKTPIIDDSGKVLYILGTITDITRDKQTEMEILERDRLLQESMLEAKRANEAKSAFLSRMSHEMRTPMNAIIGMTGIAQKSDDIDKIKDALNKIAGSSSHLLSIINDILDMSKIESGKLTLSAEPFHLPSLLSQVYTVVSVRVEEKRQRLLIGVAPDVPEHFCGDALRLTQVLTNLLYNAAKFSGEGSEISLAVSLAAREARRATVRFEVADHGIGMSEEQLGRLFSPFEQGDGGTARKYGGTGLGLAISKNLVNLMGGEIGAVSQLGEGSTFRFSVPLEVVDESRTPGGARDGDGNAAPDLKGKRILLAEDIEINREIVMALLEDTHVAIDVAENGLEAVNKVEAAPDRYQLILMDIQMPVMDGYCATERIKRINPDIPVVAMTANAFKEDVEEGRRHGMNDHIAKPIDPKILFQKIAAQIL